jgi:hypothetical protein
VEVEVNTGRPVKNIELEDIEYQIVKVSSPSRFAEPHSKLDAVNDTEMFLHTPGTTLNIRLSERQCNSIVAELNIYLLPPLSSPSSSPILFSIFRK